MSWNPPPLPDQNGDIIRYQLMIANRNKSNFLVYFVNVTNMTSFVAINLQEFEVYSFEIAAMTVIGLGPFSDVVTNQTFEDGKYMYLCSYVHTYIHTHVHIYIYTYVHTYVRTCVHMYGNNLLYSCRIKAVSYIHM